MDNDQRKAYLVMIGHRIKQLRLERELSQDELAKRSGYGSRSTINKIELGINDVPQSKVKAIAEALGVTVEDIICWEEQYNPNGQLASEVEIIELIAKQFDENAAYAFSEFIKLDNAEAKKILELISMYGKMDEVDRAEIRGYIFSKIESMLKAEKYHKKDSSDKKAM